MVVEKRRYAGIDLGKHTREMAIITRNGKFKANGQGDAEPEEKVAQFSGTTAAEGRLKRYKLLEAGDKAALEAGNMAFIMAKEMEKIAGCQVRVLNPHRLAVIYATDRKTDKEYALKLAHPVTDRPDSRLPTVAVPSDEETERRKSVSSYRRERKARTQGINRLHGTFVHAGVTTAVKKDLKTDEARRGALEQLSGTEREEADRLLKCLEPHEERTATLKRNMAERAKGDERIERLEPTR
jgi:hypothetical protein